MISVADNKVAKWGLYLVIVLSLAWMFSGCKKSKNEGGDPGKPGPVVAQPSYKYYELGSILFPHYITQGEIITGQVSGKEVKLVAIDDSTIGFIATPELYAEGGNTISFSIHEEAYSVSFNVEAAPVVADPEQVFNNYQAHQIEQKNLLMALGASDTTGNFTSPQMTEAVAAMEQAIFDMNFIWDNMDPDDKKLLANVLAANDHMFTALDEALQDIASFLYTNEHGMQKIINICGTGTPIEKYKCVATEIVIQLGIFVKNALFATLSVAVLPFKLFTAIDAIKFFGGKAIVAAANVVYITLQFIGIHVKIVYFMVWGQKVTPNGKTTSDKIVFAKDVSKTSPVEISLRRLNSGDGMTDMPWANSFVSAINNYNAICDKFSIVLSKFKINFKAPSALARPVYDLDHLKITNISNPNVSLVSISGTPAQPVIKFTTEANVEEDFTFEITYNDNVNKPVALGIDARMTLGCEAPATAQQITELTSDGNKSWKLVRVDGNDQELTNCNYPFNLYYFGNDGSVKRRLSTCDSYIEYNDTYLLCADGTLSIPFLTSQGSELVPHSVLSLTSNSLKIKDETNGAVYEFEKY